MGDKSAKTTIATAPSATVSPWVAYLTGKKVAADKFLRDMEEGVTTVVDETTKKSKKQRTHKIIRPDEVARQEFVDALASESDGVERLLLLLHASVADTSMIRRIVMDLTEAGIKRLGIISLPEPLDALAFTEAVSSWLTSLRERPLNPANFNRLLLLIHFGWYRQLLEHDTAFGFVVLAHSKVTKSASAYTQVAILPPTLLDVLLAAPTTGLVPQLLVAYFDASKAAADKLNDQIRTQEAQIARLTSENAGLRSTNAEMRIENATLKEQQNEAEARTVELEKQAVNTRATYQHKIDDVRGRIRGTLQGQITRWLQTSLDATRADPPRTEVIEERLEEALKLISKELQWLQPSA